jgi:hypothetical protein
LTPANASSTRPKSPKATRWILLTITWGAFLVRTSNLATQSLWRDEVDAIRFSSWSLRELVEGLFRAGHNGPLFFLLLRLWRNLIGDSEFVLRYPAALLGTLSVPLGFVLARQLGLSRPVGLLLGLLLATSPYLVWYGQEAKMYTLLLVLITLAFIAYLKALTGARLPSPLGKKNQTWAWWVIFVVATTLAYYTHILSPLMLAVYGIVALLYHAHLHQRWRGWLISMAILTLPYIPLALWQIPLLLEDFQSGHPFYPLKQELFLLLQLYSSGLIRFAPNDLIILITHPDNLPPLLQKGTKYLGKPLVGLIPIILFVFLFLCGLFLGKQATELGSKGRSRKTSIVNLHTVDEILPPQSKSTRMQYEQSSLSNVKGKTGIKAAVSSRYFLRNERLSLIAWTLLPPLIVYLVSLRVPVFEDRYLIYITPAFYLLVVIGLMLVWQHSRWLVGICLSLILIINLVGIWQQQRHPIKADFRAVAEYLSSQPNPPSAIMIQIPYLQYTLNYYYPGNYTLLEGLWTNDEKTEATVNTEMTALTADLTDLWLVVSEEDLWDKRHLTRAWLDEHADLVDEAHFMRVDVYHYQLRPGTIETQSTGAPVNNNQ